MVQLGVDIENRVLFVSGASEGEAKLGIWYICMYGWYVCPLKARAGNFFLLKTWLIKLDPSLF